MENRALFTETLDSLLELASGKDNILSKGEIHFYFKDIIADEAKYDHIYHFLSEKGILVEGYTATPKTDILPADGTSANELDMSRFSAEEAAHFAMYKEDLKTVTPLSRGMEADLLSQMENGSKEAYNALIEANLPLVLSLIPRFQGYGMRIGDLIQEGNLGLMEAVAMYPGNCDFTQFITDAVVTALQKAVTEQMTAQQVSEHLLERMNLLDRTSREMAEALGREASKEELSEKLHIPVDEVEAVLKHSIDALTVSAEDEEYGKDIN